MTQIATTMEQSKQLIDAGLDPTSADMQWNAVSTRKGRFVQLFVGNVTPNGMPAWSMSKLWELVADTVALGGWFSLASDKESEKVITELVDLMEKHLKS